VLHREKSIVFSEPVSCASLLPADESDDWREPLCDAPLYNVHMSQRSHHRVKYIFYLESIRPIRTAENFEAVEWATGFSNKNGCIVGLIDRVKYSI